jgi:hypothetical protein
MRHAVFLISGILFSLNAYGFDYLTVHQLYDLCDKRNDDASVQKCFGYIEGVAATMVSLTASSLDEQGQNKLNKKAETILNSGGIFIAFKKNYRDGKYKGKNIGGSNAVVDTIIQLLKEK